MTKNENDGLTGSGNPLTEIITVSMDVITAIAVIAQIQLASRHPRNNGAALKVAVSFVDLLSEKISKVTNEFDDVIRKGWNPRFDI